jgi:hypothetical protein
MNWIIGTHYKTRGGQIVEITRVTQFFGINVKFTDGTTVGLDKSGTHPWRRDWDLVQLVGSTHHPPSKP